MAVESNKCTVCEGGCRPFIRVLRGVHKRINIAKEIGYNVEFGIKINNRFFIVFFLLQEYLRVSRSTSA